MKQSLYEDGPGEKTISSSEMPSLKRKGKKEQKRVDAEIGLRDPEVHSFLA